ncbi:response regulator [Rubripirellula reticaptiva]|uniref:Virulence transcriptional regulatory protein PhoP n=1 Tax=Rubripirellula reticaptiva TaxID=2528013 RepID=A0A5C6EPK2_9BACT|nr:response regulator [Rubripirellula reticaptiva]TWU49516.1 Virulence transcriptional regulatory protein PhoP [Rubripirellula reticaptiva]
MCRYEMTDGQRPQTLEIIAADDNRSQRLLLRRCLTAAGHHIRVAKDGREALQLANEQQPDLIVTDLEMPGGNGFDLIDAIRGSDNQSLRHVPIIVCSSRSETISLNHVLDQGADSFVTKPVHVHELQLAIQNLTTL